MKLTVPERLKLTEILPEKSTYAGVSEIHRLHMILMLTNEEIIEIDAEHQEGRISWNQDKALTLIVDVPMGEWVTNVIRQILREKDLAGDLDRTEMSLFERFIIDYQVET